MDATYIFLKNKFNALPIIENEMAMGIITIHDLLALALAIPYALLNEDDLEFDPS
jgi:CBS domain-containing protein